jgi:hypothetical protein
LEFSVLSFSLADEGRTVEINCDEEGMAKLIKAPERVRADGGHIHLRALADGGRDLDEKTPWGTDAIYEVVLNWIRD